MELHLNYGHCKETKKIMLAGALNYRRRRKSGFKLKVTYMCLLFTGNKLLGSSSWHFICNPTS